jgi:NAD-dependent protein deacetylase/lipoamidase
MIPAEAPVPADLVEALRHSSSVVVISGAGISAESGVPTFRGAGGLWKQFRAEELATPQAFERDPALVWEWYQWRRGLVAACRPNAAHEVVARMDRSYEDFLLVTQNVDGLHERAGSTRFVEVHGSLFRLRCTEHPSHVHPHPAGSAEPLPRCPSCGALGRPDVVWFGEHLDQELMDRAVRALETCEVALVVGTSGVVYPVASLPLVAAGAGARVAVINLEPSPLFDVADDAILGTAAARMSELAAALGI